MVVRSKTTQSFVPIKEVRDGIIVLKDGGVRAILIASSINLSLKSDEEQKAIILGFQTFLNSLDFSTQIIIRSRELDINPYIALLENRMREQLEPLLKIQTREYISFIRGFTESVNIMTKNFYLVVPYTSSPLGARGTVTKNFFKNSGSQTAKIDAFEEQRSQLEQRISVIQGGLSRIGIRTIQLGTEEVVELFYKTFNPGEVGQGMKID